MNSPTKISPDTQLILDELRKLSGQFEQFIVQVASWGARISTQFNGGLFDGGDSDEQLREAAVVADNWGGLFEPVSMPEERVYEYAASDAASPPLEEELVLDVAAVEEIEPEEYPYPIQEELQDAGIGPLEAALSKRETEMWALAGWPRLHVSPLAPAIDTVFNKELSDTTGKAIFTNKSRLSCKFPLPQIDVHCLYELGARWGLKRSVGPIKRVPMELPLHSRDGTCNAELRCATGVYGPWLMALLADLNAPRDDDEPVFVVTDMQRDHNDFASNDPDLLRCVRLTFRLGSVECVLRVVLLGNYDGLLNDNADVLAPFDPGPEFAAC